MSGHTPWWFSGEPEEARASRPRVDLGQFTSGAQFLLDLARQALVAPHAGHTTPADHPECLICRTMAVVSEASTTATSAPADASRIEWITLDPPQR